MKGGAHVDELIAEEWGRAGLDCCVSTLTLTLPY